MQYRTVDPDEARTLVDEGWIYLDVRTVEEFDAGHADGAFNVPFAVVNQDLGRMEPNPEFCEVVRKNFAADDRLVVACAAGGRSMHACEALVAEGFGRLVNMHGGFSGARDMAGNVQQAGWSELGHPTATEPRPERTYEVLRGK